jgi:hypothetical protein
LRKSGRASTCNSGFLAAAERDLEAFTARYRALKEICAIVEKAKVAAKAKRTNSETRAAA